MIRREMLYFLHKWLGHGPYDQHTTEEWINDQTIRDALGKKSLGNRLLQEWDLLCQTYTDHKRMVEGCGGNPELLAVVLERQMVRLTRSEIKTWGFEA